MVVDKKNLSDGTKPKVMALSFNEQATRIQDAVARRAYEIFASRAPESGNAIGDWRQAEAAMVKPLCCGLMPFGDHLWVEVDAAPFEPGSIEVWVAARNITICGKPCSSRMDAREARHGARGRQGVIFRVLDLPVEVGPYGTSVKLRGPSMEILLPKIRTAAPQKATAA
jgi:hypothetical protein